MFSFEQILCFICQDLARDLHFKLHITKCKSRTASGLTVCMITHMFVHICQDHVHDLHFQNELGQGSNKMLSTGV